MNDALLEKIRSKAYWRVNLRPVTLPEVELSLPDCSAAVERSHVELRGWDYPHISRRNDDQSGYGPAGDYYEHWIDWEHHIEFWRMYRSSQFLHYRALGEDWEVWTKYHSGHPPTPGAVSILGVTWLFTEIFEFAFRLFRNGLYASGVKVSIRLEGAKNRHLWVSEFNRMPFSYDRITLANVVDVRRTLDAETLRSADQDYVTPAIVEFFQNFDWSPSSELIRSDQEKLVTKTF